MPVADLRAPSRLLAGGGPSSPDPRVLRSLTAPLVGQFDPHFTAIMDDVMQLARATFLTRNERCFGVSGTGPAGLESLLNTLVEAGDQVAIGGGQRFIAETAETAGRCGAQVLRTEAAPPGTKLMVVPLIDPFECRLLPIKELAAACHSVGARLIVEATLGLGARELHVDAWGIDACTVGVDFALGAPAGMALVTYTREVEALMQARRSAPRTSYLDLLQLQAYWSPERLNHHTAPTSLVYGLREALRLVHEEGLEQRWARHARVGQALVAGLVALDFEVGGVPPYAVVRTPAHAAEAELRHQLLTHFGVHIRAIAADLWRIGLLGADAKLEGVLLVLAALEQVLRVHASGAIQAAISAYGGDG